MHRPARHPGTPSRSRVGGGRQARIVASIAAFVLVLSAVVPAWAAAGPTKLSDPTVSPLTGYPTTTIVVTVSYRNREGTPANWVRVKLGATTHAMTKGSGADWKRGVTFRWSGKLAVGSYPVTISALSRDRFADQITAGTVTIKPTPKPDPTPKPTPKPTPRPTPKPQPRTTPRPTERVTPRTAPTQRPTASPTPGVVVIGGDPVPTPTASSSPSPSDDRVAFVVGRYGSGPGGDDVAGAGSIGSGGPSADGGNAGTWAAFAAGIDLLTGGRPTVPLGLVATMVTTSGIVGATLAFGLFGKRRRDGDPPAPDDVLAHAAGSPLAVAAAAGYADRPGRSVAVDEMDPVPGVTNIPNPHDAELALPRWRRPSLLEARKADPIRDAVEAPRLTFAHGLVGPIDGRERRLIRYNLVRLLDIPDELRGTELAFLDQGDEVQLLEKRGAYWLVLCPDGRQGWIHKMTLGEQLGDPPAQSTPTATMPIAADTWTMGDDVDGDVLAAYLESRRRA
ncbi:MAG TPA: hypothetical protein VFN41_01160 [Candidatus Limnocylindrales bacterium]|nr:hypothetical protein [Candidatus Limnocylindrales bacterium]